MLGVTHQRQRDLAKLMAGEQNLLGAFPGRLEHYRSRWVSVTASAMLESEGGSVNRDQVVVRDLGAVESQGQEKGAGRQGLDKCNPH